MVRISLMSTFLSFLAPLSMTFSSLVDAHGYLKSPRARNFIAYEEGVWSGSSPIKYPKESCPHCLNLGGTLGRCGATRNAKYDQPKSRAGSIMPPDPQLVVQQGSEITVDIILSAHHKGHFEFKACPMDGLLEEAPTQDCFDRHPLTLVKDELYGASPDPNYPNRAYIPPSSYSGIISDTSGVSGTLYQYTLQLPADLKGSLVLLQWHYLTANSCKFAGYDDYDFPAAWGNMNSSIGICSLPLPPDGSGVPEQFWNCAEISVIGKSSTASTMPAPTMSPSLNENHSNTIAPAVPTPFCGDGRVGGGFCENRHLCCSEWGWCGDTPAHCRGKSTPSPVSPTNENVISNRTPSPVAEPVRRDLVASPTNISTVSTIKPTQ